MMALLWLCKYAITCVSPQNRLKCVNIGGHYGRFRGNSTQTYELFYTYLHAE